MMIEGCRAFPGQAPADSDRQRVPGPKQQADDLCGRMRGPAGASWGRCQRRGAYVRLPPERAHPGAVSWPWGGSAGRRRRRPLTPRDEPWAASALARARGPLRIPNSPDGFGPRVGSGPRRSLPKRLDVSGCGPSQTTDSRVLTCYRLAVNDTSSEAARVQALVHRRMGGPRKLLMACQMSDAVRALASARIRSRNPELNEREVRDELIWELYGIRRRR